MEKMEFFGISFEPSHVEYNPSTTVLSREAVFRGAKHTDFGALAMFPKVKSRLEQVTEIKFGGPTDEQRKEIAEAFLLMKEKPLYCLDRLLGQNRRFQCTLFISKEFPGTALIWGSLLRDIYMRGARSDFLTVSIPEFPRQHVYIFPDHNPPLVILLGIDYGGEHKMAFLRLFNHAIKAKGEGLGLHASLITFHIVDAFGVTRCVNAAFLAGSGTGKTTLTSHGYGLYGEDRAIIRQDDIIAWLHDGEVLGTEQRGFYVITAGLTKEGQPTIWDALQSKDALFENVMLKDGKPDFNDTLLSKNPRGVVPVSKLARTDGVIDAPELHCLFILCRMGGITPPIMRLSSERAAYQGMVGSTVDTAAVDPSRIGQSRNLPLLNPFMIGDGPLAKTQAEEGNIFLTLVREHPKTQIFLLNTGTLGGGVDRDAMKITVSDSADFILNVIEGRVWPGGDTWRPSILGLGYEEPERTRGGTFDTRTHFTAREFAELLDQGKKREAEWLEQFRQYLDPSVMLLCMK